MTLAYKEIKKHPLKSLKNCFFKSLDILSRYAPWPDSETKWRKINHFYHIFFLCLFLPFSLLGIFQLYREKRIFALIFFLIPIINTFAIAFVFYGTSRFRITIDPQLIILSIFGYKKAITIRNKSFFSVTK